MPIQTPPLLSGDALKERAALATGLPLPRALGVHLIDTEDPAAGAQLTVGDLADNGAGGVHAAAINLLLELAGYLALAPHLDISEHAVTHSASTSLVASARSGETVTAHGTLDRRTRRLAFVDVTAENEGTLLARCQLVKSIVPWPAPQRM